MKKSDGEPLSPNRNIETATFGMGCFWSPESLFGHLPGVIRTRVGYAGGTSNNPTYRQMGDHTEMVQLDFDPGIIPYKQLVELFWSSHNPVNINDYKGRQYQSLLFYADGQQRDIIRQVLNDLGERGESEPDTEIVPNKPFYVAEDKHQKYYLKRHPSAIEKLGALYPSHGELVGSTLAARLNGLAKGYTNLERILNEMSEWPIDSGKQKEMTDLVKQIKW